MGPESVFEVISHIYIAVMHFFFFKSRHHLVILGARMVTRNKFRIRNIQILGAIVQNWVSTVT